MKILDVNTYEKSDGQMDVAITLSADFRFKVLE